MVLTIVLLALGSSADWLARSTIRPVAWLSNVSEQKAISNLSVAGSAKRV